MLASALIAAPCLANTCATPAKNGSPSSLSGVVNTYFGGATSAPAGSTSIALGYGGGDINVGDLLLVIQMQDAAIVYADDSSYGDGNGSDAAASGYAAIRSAGLYEFVRATSFVPFYGGTVTIAGTGPGGGLLNSYVNADAAADAGQRRFQVILVPQYNDATLSGTLSAMSWDGYRGGVAAIDVAGTLTLAGGGVDVSGAGFRGGGKETYDSGSGGYDTGAFAYVTPTTDHRHGSKGEGVAGTPRYLAVGYVADNGPEGYPGGSRARGAPGNAGGGGNDADAGGGGGGNAGAGGRGGNSWCNDAVNRPCNAVGGEPGARIAEIGVGRVTMGGAGGAGATSNGSGNFFGYASSGAAGGGIIMVRAGAVTGSGSFLANGNAGDASVGNDGAGGGGAGGAVLIAATRVAGASIVARANGGNGGVNSGETFFYAAPHGPGGGGGGGFVATTMAASASANGGAAGRTHGGASYGAGAGSGASGTTTTGAAIPGLSSGGECTPVVAKSFSVPSGYPGQTTRLTVTVRNYHPTRPLTDLAFVDDYPAFLANASVSNLTSSCGTGTLTGAANATRLTLAAGTVGVGAQCSYAIDLKMKKPGTGSNTLEAGTVAGRLGTSAVANAAAAAAAITVLTPLSVVKTSMVLSDPYSSPGGPKLVPGGFVTYSLKLTSMGPVAIDANTVVLTNLTAAGLSLFVGDAVTAGSGPVRFVDDASGSGLTYSFAGLSSTSDDVDFSKDNGSTWSYVPVPDANGVDPAVSAIRVRPKGSMAASRVATLELRYRMR